MNQLWEHQPETVIPKTENNQIFDKFPKKLTEFPLDYKSFLTTIVANFSLEVR